MRIAGTICEAGSGRAIENLIVRAYQRDLLFDEPLGFDTTRADGRFEIRTTEREGATTESAPGLFVRVLDPTGEHEIYDTLGHPPLDPETGEEFAIAVPAENLSPRFERRDRSADTAPEFVRALWALTPRIFVTPALVFLNVAVFALLVLLGASPLAPEVATLVDWGANQGIRTIDDEWWRLVACLFLHGGILHLAFIKGRQAVAASDDGKHNKYYRIRKN